MKWAWCCHQFTWGPIFRAHMSHQRYSYGVPIGEAVRYEETRQRGSCVKCGLVKERVVYPGMQA